MLFSLLLCEACAREKRRETPLLQNWSVNHSPLSFPTLRVYFCFATIVCYVCPFSFFFFFIFCALMQLFSLFVIEIINLICKTFTSPRPPRLAPATCSALAENIAVHLASK